MNTKKYISGALALATVAGLGLALPLFADTNVTAGVNVGVNANANSQAWGSRMGVRGGQGMMRSGVSGTVLTNDGSILTITVKKFTKPVAGATTPPVSTTVTYTVTTTSATTVTKAGVTSTVSAIAVGDTVAVQGTISGTNVAATTIRDGVMVRGSNGQGGEKGANGGSQSAGNVGSGTASLVAGNGQPIVGGAITVIAGNTLTVTNKSNVTYTVDATSAKFLQGKTTITLADLKVGDTVVVQGAVTGNAVKASTVIDQGSAQSAGNVGIGTTNPGKHLGFFGGIGQFFAHLFGF